MKLTNYIRDAFVRAVMNDVPAVDYAEQMREVITKDAISQLPDKVRAIYKNSSTTHYVASFWYGGKYSDSSVMVPGISGDFKPTEATQQAIAGLKKKHDAQFQSNADLKASIRAVAYSVTTRKALADLLPEFAKYLPADEAAAIKTLPVVTNVVSSFVKAGWPKDKKLEAKTAVPA